MNGISYTIMVMWGWDIMILYTTSIYVTGTWYILIAKHIYSYSKLYLMSKYQYLYLELEIRTFNYWRKILDYNYN